MRIIRPLAAAAVSGAKERKNVIVPRPLVLVVPNLAEVFIGNAQPITSRFILFPFFPYSLFQPFVLFRPHEIGRVGALTRVGYYFFWGYLCHVLHAYANRRASQTT